MLMELLVKFRKAHINLSFNDGKLSFKAPKGALTGELKAQITEQKSVIIDLLDRLGCDSNSIAPLSWAQERLWVVEQLQKQSTQFNMPGEFLLPGVLNKQAIEHTVQALLQRHSILRTNIVVQDGQPIQVVNPTFAVPVDFIDLVELELDAQETELARLRENDWQRPFDLSRDLMLRMQVVSLSSTQHRVLLNMHHIASDGWSVQILLREFAALYDVYSKSHAYGENIDTGLLPLKVQYADYAVWQKDWLSGSLLEEQMQFWRKYLDGMPPVHSLPTRHIRGASFSSEGMTFNSSISPALVAQLKVLCQSRQVSLFMLLQTTFSLLLSRFSQMPDIVMGTPISGRTHQDVESLVGFFVNTLVLRTEVDETLSFEEFLAQNKAQILETFVHQHVPFDLLVDELGSERSLSHTALIQIMFSVEAEGWNQSVNETIQVETHTQSQTESKYELTLRVLPSDDSLVAEWSFARDVFDEVFVRRLACAYQALLTEIVANPATNIMDYPLGSGEVMRLDAEWLSQSPWCEVIPEPVSALTSKVALVDAQARQVPIGAIGRLICYGDGLNRVSPQESAMSNEGQFDTGYLARYESGVGMVPVGAVSDYVEVNRVMINLADISAKLVSHAAVEAVKLLVLNQGEESQLVACVVSDKAKDDPSLLFRTIKHWLEQQLADYLVPQGFCLVDSDDFSLLHTPEMQSQLEPEWVQEEQFLPPETELERKVADIWQDLLNIETIGLNDNFFVLGGNSLTAVRLEFALRQELEVQVSTRDIFTHANLGGLVRLLERKTRQTTMNIPVVSREQDLPLSFSQQRLWFIDQLQAGSAHYNIPVGLRLRGHLNQAALQRAFDHIVARHEILRTCYQYENGTVSQIVHEAASLPMIHKDLSDLPTEQKEEQAKHIANQDAITAFDLTQGSMLRVTLVKLDDAEHYLLCNMHHIASDGWSLGVLVRELSALYQAYTSESQHQLDPLPLQYADYAAWQNNQLSGDTLDTYLNFWCDYLKDAPTIHSLPLDRSRTAVASLSHSYIRRRLGTGLTESLNQLANQHGATLFMLLNAGLACLISRLSDEDDIVIGTAIANRDNPALEPMIGCFVNTLALRTKLTAAINFNQLITTTKAQTLTAYEYQQMPFEKLVSELLPERSNSHHPLFQIMLLMQNNREETLVLPGLEADILVPENAGNEFDITLSVTLDSGELALIWQYNQSLFNASTLENIATYFETLLAAMVDAPDQPIYQLPLIDQNNIVTAQPLNPTVVQDSDQCIHTLVEYHVSKNPDAIAIEMNGITMTYGELNSKANRIAHCLRNKGVKENDVVGIYANRNFELIIGVLGILKSGAAYLPIDPAYPINRIAYMLDDAKLSWLLSDQELDSELSVMVKQIIPLSESDNSSYETNNPEPVTGSNNREQLAYVIYTSGSTGGPKGVQVTHQNVCAYLAASQQVYGVTADDVVLQFSSPSFDIFVEEFTTALCNGAMLILRNEEILQGGDYFWQFVRDKHISIMSFAAEFWHSLCRQIDGALTETNAQIETGALRILTVGGEAMSLALLEKWNRAIGEQVVLYNVYGPTEGTAVATYFDTREVDVMDTSVPIGRPFENHYLLVLDEYMNLCPPGVKGELYLSGSSVAMGYRNKPEITQQKFVPNPYFEKGLGGQVLYRTGDVVQIRNDRQLAFCGRQDDQVKLRGYRIELKEIEYHINALDCVNSSLVLVSDLGGQKQLVAYIIANQAQQIQQQDVSFIAGLRQQLAATLPSYMMPAAFLLIDSIPMTENGKVNKVALPQPDLSSQHAFSAPASALETHLSTIWIRLLGIPEVGVETSFFEIGGHSLLVTQLVSEIRQEMQVELPLKALFENDTIRLQAGLIEQANPSEQTPIPVVDRTGNLPLSYAQQRLWLENQVGADRQRYNMPAAFQLRGSLNKQALQRAFEAIVERHEILRTVYAQDHQGQGVQLPLSDLMLSIEEYDLSNMSARDEEQMRQKIIAQTLGTEFDLGRDLMLKVGLISHASDKHTLLVSMHHIASDGWSVDILIRELVTLYKDFSANKSCSLAPLPIQYADYAQWQQKVLAGERHQELMQYWRETLQDVPLVHGLPVKTDRSSISSYSGGSITQVIPDSLSTRVLHLAESQGMTLYMLIHSALSVLLARWSNDTDIVIGTPVTGREHRQLEDLIGFFVNALPIRTQIDSQQSFEDLLAQCKQNILTAFEHQDMPFDRLVEALQPDRSLGQSPLFQVMLSVNQGGDTAIRLPQLEVEPIELESQFVRFELTINVFNENGQINIIWEYLDQLYEAETIAALSTGFEALLEAVSHDPKGLVSEVPVTADPLAFVHGVQPAQYQEYLQDWPSTVVIGADKLQVVDQQLQPLPRGCVGEVIAVGKTSIQANDLATGQLLWSEDKAEPSWIYRNNTLGQIDNAGHLAIKGRLDKRIKFGGQILDLNPIEALLPKNEYVKKAWLQAELVEGEQHLVAYIQPSLEVTDELLLLTTVRRWLQSQVPEFALPSYYAAAELVDAVNEESIHTLPEYTKHRIHDKEYRQPTTDTERALADLWLELLSVEQIGLDDNFFVLGGNSLTAVRLQFAIDRDFAVKTTVKGIFEHPELHMLARFVDESMRTEQEFIPKLDSSEPHILSAAQRRLWFIDQLSGNKSHHYNIPLMLKVEGELDIRSLEQALTQIIMRHEILRTVYVVEDNGEGSQVVLPASDFNVKQCDISKTMAAQRMDQVQQLANQEAQRAFNLSTDLMLRAVVVKLEEQQHVLIITLHHIAADGWSLGVMVRELAAFYQASHSDGSIDQQVSLPELSIQYGDFAVWQQKKFQQPEFTRQLEYWQQHLNNLPSLHSLPLDYPRPTQTSYAGEVITLPLSPALEIKVQALCQRTETSPFMFYQALFSVLLARWSGERDIVFGTPISGRNQGQVEPLIGLFVNTLVLRHDTAGNPSFLDYLQGVKKTVLDAFENQDAPFDVLVDRLVTERSTNHAPLIQILFAMQNNDIPELKLPGLSIAGLPVDNTTAKFDLSLHVSEGKEGTYLAWEFCTELFSLETMERVAGYFSELLEAVVEQPERHIMEIPLVASEHLSTPVQASETVGLQSNEQTAFLHRLFEQQAEMHAEKTAVTFGSTCLSYGELNGKANQLARYLQQSGVVEGNMVGLYMDRSIDMLMAILAVLKCGCAYVPIDPLYPKSRIQHILSDADIPLLVTHQAANIDQINLEELVASIPIVNIDELRHQQGMSRQLRSNLGIVEANTSDTRSGKNPAYVIYTSGSTGKPKGVVVEHCNVLSLFAASEQHFDFGPEHTWTLFHSFAFDFSVWEIWGALLYGGKLVVVPFEVSRSSAEFYQLLQQEKVTVLNQTPSAFYTLAEEVLSAPQALALEYVIFGGEALEPKKLKNWIAHFGDDSPQLINMYGITETTVHVTYRRVLDVDTDSASSVIGYPLPHLKVHVCNEYQVPQPVGFPGELYVGGSGVAQGYLNRPQLTAERFIDDPVGDTMDKFYKTGDWVRLLANGELEYLSRVDHQVKIRGFRIELGEIEFEITNTGLAKSVVVDTRSSQGQPQLIAYVVPDAPETDSLAHEIREAIADKLPDYMLPSAFVFLEHIPLTTNGKVDRKALADQDTVEVARESYVPPSNELERKMCAIWAEILELDKVGIHDNFFAIGGDSIKVIKVVKQAELQQIYLRVADIFALQSVRDLTQHYLEHKAGQTHGEAPANMALLEQQVIYATHVNDEVEDCFPVSQLQKLMLNKHIEAGVEKGVYQPQTLFQIKNITLREDLILQVLTYLLAKHPNLRSRFIRLPDGEYAQTIVRDTKPDFKLLDWTHINKFKLKGTVSDLVNGELDAGFEFGRACIRFRLIKINDTHWGLFIATHHAIEDGWGFVEFTKELASLYRQLEQGGTLPPLDQVSHVFKEHVALELEYRESADYRRVWENLLADYQPLRMAKLDNASVPAFREYEQISYKKALVRNLKETAAAFQVPLKTLLLLAYQRVLMTHLDIDNLAVDVVSSGRSSRLSDPINAIGLFWNLLPICSVNRENSDLLQIKQLGERLLTADSHANYPVDLLAEITGETQSCQIAFNFVNFHNQDEEQLLGDKAKVELIYGVDNFHHPIKLALAVEKGVILGSLEYSSRYFTAKTVKKITKALQLELKKIATLHRSSLPQNERDPQE